MASKQKNQGLHVPKITKLSKQQYRKFRNVRKLYNEAMGQHQLLSNEQKKYISKQLPISMQFLTTRPKNQTVYHYSLQGYNTYIFELMGQPLVDLWREHQGQQLKQWIQRCGGLQSSLYELIRYCLKIYIQYGISDILPDCFRVSEAKLYYCYDTWMKSTYEIICTTDTEIQNYFLSETQLKALNKNKSNHNIQITNTQFLYKLGLFILSLALPQVKIRNYDYYSLAINKVNVQQKMRLFKIKMCNKQLINLISLFISGQCIDIEQIRKILEQNSKSKRGISPISQQSKSATKNKTLNQSQSKHLHSKENYYLGDSSYIRKNSRKSLFQPQLALNTSFNNARKIKLRGRKIGSQLTNISQQIVQTEYKQSKCKKGFSLKDTFSKPPTNYSNKILQYLGLNEHISQSEYQINIIKCLQDVKIKADWKHKVYQNGSIYFGQLLGQKRQGKGIYLFDSQDFYYGDWTQNVINGVGTYVFRSGQCYCGQLRKGLKQGFGKFIYKDGRIYQGNWEENVKFGFGTVLYPNETKFLGFFQKQAETYGIFTWLENDQLMQNFGNFSNYNWETNQFLQVQSQEQIIKTKLKLQHSIMIPNFNGQNSRYYGNCIEGRPDGHGVKQSQKQIYEGFWRNGKQDGQGKLIVKNKYEIEAKWKQGIIVEYMYK